jgi:hypothetical protein
MEFLSMISNGRVILHIPKQEKMENKYVKLHGSQIAQNATHHHHRHPTLFPIQSAKRSVTIHHPNHHLKCTRGLFKATLWSKTFDSERVVWKK